MNRFGLDPENPNYYRALCRNYRFPVRVGPPRMSVDDIPSGATEVELHRKGKSHEGISHLTDITALAAVAVNQDFLDEIGQLTKLEQLDLRYPMRAPDISPLRNLKELRILHIDSPSAVTDFSPIADLPNLEVLTIENARHLSNLDWIRPLKEQLITLGLEGSISTDQKIESLEPLEGFTFEALFMTSSRLVVKDLTPLTTCPNLMLLDCARFAPRPEFKKLEDAKPDLLCTWYDDWGWQKVR